MNPKKDPVMICCGRPVTPDEITSIQETVKQFSNLSLRELAQTICEHLDWCRDAGENKIEATCTLLEALGAEGVLTLPEKIIFYPRTDPQPILNCKLQELGEVDLEVVKNEHRTHLWDEYVQRYHYLGYTRAEGHAMRYFIRSEQGILGCIFFSRAAESMAARDSWIGWTPAQRRKNLAWVINNTRFLIFPWVEVRYLASHVLGRITRSVGADWQTRFGYTPALVEAFVDPKLYEGVCYQASNWECLGMTPDRALTPGGNTYQTTPKKIYVKPLTRNFRAILCGDHPDTDPGNTDA